MHRIGQKTTLQERVTIGKQAAAGRTDAQIAAKLDCSVWTVRKWWRNRRIRSQKQHTRSGKWMRRD